MARKHHYRRRLNEPHELDVTTFLNLMVALIPFLLVSAVFSRIAILQLNLPAVDGDDNADVIQNIEITIRDSVLELGDGNKILSSYKKTPSGYDLTGLSGALASLKTKYPDKTDATILLEPQIQYEHLVSVMDTVRSRQFEKPDDNIVHQEILFPRISIGDAP